MTRIIAVVIACVLAIAANAAWAADAKRILIFGDSNSWGWIPQANGIPSQRYPADKRWPGVLQAELGQGYEVVTDALSGRTTDLDDPTAPVPGAGMNGATSLPAVLSAHIPIDLVVIMLGTNDTKAQFKRTPFRIALGAGRLVDIVQSSGKFFGGGWVDYPTPQVLLLSPPPLAKQTILGEVFDGETGVERSKGLASAYSAIAEAAGVSFFDVGTATPTDGVDAVHFTEAAQRKIGIAVAEQVRKILP